MSSTLTHMPRPIQRIIALVVFAIFIFAGGPWIFINFIKDKAPSAFELQPSSTSTVIENVTDVNGDWSVIAAGDSMVGYRVKEVLFGQSTEGVGRTKFVDGDLTIANNSVTKASFTVQMASFMSDAAKRDAQFNNRIMDVMSYPTSTFTLSSPIALPDNATSGQVISTEASGQLTLRGVTKDVKFPLQAQLTGSTFTVVGSITIVFDEWGIPEPGLPGITVNPEGLLEFSLEFSRQS